MMGAISRKLRGQHGASLLLALLFLLICSMVTASILMAAVSNAGKHSSNLEEHQIYLALSSAVSTLCDELNQSEYRGYYQCWRVETTTENDDGTTTTTITKYFEQLDGQYTGHLLPILRDDFDAIFAEEINRSLPTDVIKSGIKNGTLVSHTLTLTPQTGTELDDKTVTLTLQVKSSYALYITAYLNGLESYRIEAELTPNDNKPALSNLDYALSPVTGFTEPMKWKLGWITIWDEEKGDDTVS